MNIEMFQTNLKCNDMSWYGPNGLPVIYTVDNVDDLRRQKRFIEEDIKVWKSEVLEDYRKKDMKEWKFRLLQGYRKMDMKEREDIKRMLELDDKRYKRRKWDEDDEDNRKGTSHNNIQVHMRITSSYPSKLEVTVSRSLFNHEPNPEVILTFTHSGNAIVPIKNDSGYDMKSKMFTKKIINLEDPEVFILDYHKTGIIQWECKVNNSKETFRAFDY